MNIEKLKGFYERLYFAENEKKDKINNKIQMIFGLLMIEATVVTYLFKNTSFKHHEIFAFIVIALAYVSVCFIFYVCFFLKKAFWGNEFKYIPKPDDINKYYIDLVNYEVTYKQFCKDNEMDYDGEYSSSKKINEYLITQLVECTSWNTKVNEVRTAQIYHATKFFSSLYSR
ncbi:hypothetical protein ETAR_14990 [Edwardsiella tarda]